MKTQEIYDKVSIHLLLQNEKSIGGDECRYRGDSGLMCAVGCLVKDKYYNVNIEGLTIGQTTVYKVLQKSIGKLSKTSVYLLTDLQVVHDKNDISSWHSELLRLADVYNLEYDVLDFAITYCEGL
jgi:hypothetical protein